ncbi:helix-turn-helix domain-containing protein [Cupriavidus pauculus]|uniref:Helix-turn-helix domain-containing protein n=1 Tax=Cupriavidus pauculus TaxID=82633 RepID=A0A5P2HD23_9BURK|nr:helix-turn-helix domain-containing protein [Cupriavidus pauculus]QET05916.1 helix-turn-helix domain-containing protein [Cupriavidus pauculus]
MPRTPHLSPKLHLTASHGFALHESRQPGFQRAWHMHDCGMLLWPRAGRLRTVWDVAAPPSDDATADDAAPDATHDAMLVRGTAVLLPASTTHVTTSDPGRQHHGELYLPPDRLRECRQFGALHLDAATVAMLDALLAPTITAQSAAFLVRAIVEQIVTGRLPALPAAVPAEPASIVLRMVRRFTSALERDQAMPSIDAVAADLGVSIRRLQRACQIELGASPVEVRRRMLASHARALLASGQTAARVSVQLGFASSGHLHRLLRDID